MSERPPRVLLCRYCGKRITDLHGPGYLLDVGGAVMHLRCFEATLAKPARPVTSAESAVLRRAILASSEVIDDGEPA